MADKLVIKRGDLKVVDIERSNLIAAEPSHDGIVFTFKHGIQVYFTDNYMELFTKDLIKNAVNSFPSANLTIDVLNAKQPVLVEPTKK